MIDRVHAARLARRLLSPRDWLGCFAAFAVGACSLVYPFGRDQGLYFYIGREWWLHGSLPYRDSFDVKTPGIYLLNALSYAWFGNAQWGIRCFDMLVIGVLGWLVARCATRAGEPLRPGLVGLGVFAASVFYYGHFDYWHTAQCELYCSAFALLAIVIARSLPPAATRVRVVRTAVLAGLATGLAALFKPPALLLCAVGFVLLLERISADGGGRARLREHVQRSALASVAFGAGTALVPVTVIAYFALAGGLAELYDVLVVNNQHYVVQGRWADSLDEVYASMLEGYQRFDPAITWLWLALLVALVHAMWRRDREAAVRRATPLVLLLAAHVIVLAQMKFVHYHWGVIVVPLALGCAVIAHDGAQWIERERRPGVKRGRAIVVQIATAVLVTGTFFGSGSDFIAWVETVRGAVRYQQGQEERSVFLQRFALDEPYRYAPARLEQVGEWLRANTLPEDLIAVRGFEPELYVIAERRFNGRFFWTTFLSTPSWAYRMQDWIVEDRRVFERAPPRWVLALDWAEYGVDSPAYFEALGYVRSQALPPFVLMEHWSMRQRPDQSRR